MLCRSHVRARPSTKTGLPVGHSSSSSDGPAQTVILAAVWEGRGQGHFGFRVKGSAVIIITV